MDGWAYRHADVASGDGATVMKRVGTSYAGKPYLGPVGGGECVRIFTGAVMPPDCDTGRDARARDCGRRRRSSPTT